MNALRLGARAILAGVFLCAGLIKAGASQQFAVAIVPFTIIPPEWISPIAHILPIIEVIAGILILVPKIHPAGSVMILTLCVFYISMLGWALANDIIVDCGCFGNDSTPSATKMWASLWRDMVFAAMALFALVRLPARNPGSGQKIPASG